MKKLIIGYIQREIKYIGLYLGCVGIFCTVLFLYNKSFEGIDYAVTLSCSCLIGVLIIDYIKYRKQYKQVVMALSALPYELREFPKGTDELENLYQEKMLVQQKYLEELESKMRMGNQRMLDYYSLWVHQIKTPIAAMRLLIQKQESTDLNEFVGNIEKFEMQQEDFFRRLKIELFKTDQYVEMVLSYFRMEDMSSDLVLQWYSLDTIVRQAVKKYAPLFIMKKIHLEYRACDTMVLTDEKWFVFVLEQILSNALKYTTSGSITIYQEEGERGRLVVSDTGIGIQAEDLPRIFEKGFTGYNGRQDKKSTGIGLYLCKCICDKLNHRIFVESEVEVGTRVCLDIRRREIHPN